MSCRATTKVATTTASTLQNLWISDDLLTEAFNRFLRISHVHRRYGSNVPGPLEARRRHAKRRMGVAAVASGSGAPPSYDVGVWFGRPPPEFEKGWRWQPPVPAPPPPAPTKVDFWPLPRFDGSVEQSIVEDENERRVEKFLEIPEDPVETSTKAFEKLLEASQSKNALDLHDIEPMLDFLQSSANEPQARLTLQLAQWLTQRVLTTEASQALAALINQKITLCTIEEEEQSAVLVQLLHRDDATSFIPNILHQISTMQAILKQTTSAILESTSNDSSSRKHLLLSWLACLRATKYLNLVEENVYAPLSRHFNPSDFPDHFAALDPENFAKLFLRHWVADLVHRDYANPVAQWKTSVNWKALRSQYEDIRSSKNEYLSSKKPLVDLISLLAKNKLPYSAVLDELFTLWRKTESASGVVNLIRQLRDNQPSTPISSTLATTIIQSFIQTGDLGLAFDVFSLVRTVSLKQCRDLPLKLIEQGEISSSKIWRIFDRWAEDDGVPLHERKVRKEPLQQDLVNLVHEVAYAWATSPPQGQIRVAWRRVWECYRFLQDSHSPLSNLISRALVRAGVVNFVRERRPVPQERVQYLLELVGKIEGEEVRREVDKMIFRYWIANRNLTRYKPDGVKKRELRGERILEDGTLEKVIWRPRVSREAVERRHRAEKVGRMREGVERGGFANGVGIMDGDVKDEPEMIEIDSSHEGCSKLGTLGAMGEVHQTENRSKGDIEEQSRVPVNAVETVEKPDGELIEEPLERFNEPLESFTISYQPPKPSEIVVEHHSTAKPRSSRRPRESQAQRKKVLRHPTRSLEDDMLVTWTLRPAEWHRQQAQASQAAK